MLTTNLLPIREKKRIAREETRRILRFYSVATVCAFSICASLLLPTFIPLVVERNDFNQVLAVENSATVALKIDDTLNEMKNMVRTMRDIEVSLAEPPKASPTLNQFLEFSGSGITISNIRVMAADRGFTLEGVALNRRDLLEFERVLRESGKFQEITSPLSNIIRESNIAFTISGSFKQGYGL